MNDETKIQVERGTLIPKKRAKNMMSRRERVFARRDDIIASHNTVIALIDMYSRPPFRFIFGGTMAPDNRRAMDAWLIRANIKWILQTSNRVAWHDESSTKPLFDVIEASEWSEPARRQILTLLNCFAVLSDARQFIGLEKGVHGVYITGASPTDGIITDAMNHVQVEHARYVHRQSESE